MMNITTIIGLLSFISLNGKNKSQQADSPIFSQICLFTGEDHRLGNRLIENIKDKDKMTRVSRFLEKMKSNYSTPFLKMDPITGRYLYIFVCNKADGRPLRIDFDNEQAWWLEESIFGGSDIVVHEWTCDEKVELFELENPSAKSTDLARIKRLRVENL